MQKSKSQLITEETIKTLMEKLERLLLGIATTKNKFKTIDEKNQLIESIKIYSKYRLNQGIITDKTIIEILKEVETLNFNSPELIEHSIIRLHRYTMNQDNVETYVKGLKNTPNFLDFYDKKS